MPDQEQRNWLSRHLSDPFVKQAQKDGYRSRSAYKLIELNEKDKLIRPGMRIMDLGSAPGGWSQVAGKLVGAKGRVLATDILPMEALAMSISSRAISPKTPSCSSCSTGSAAGSSTSSFPTSRRTSPASIRPIRRRSIYFLELALDTVRKTLKPGATFVAKMFQGAGSDQYLKELRTPFEKVLIRKPAASRKESREVYLVAKGFKG